MFLFEVLNVIYTSIYLIMFCICYFLVISMRVEVLFRKGSVWQIRAFQFILAGILAYFISQAIFSLVKSF